MFSGTLPGLAGSLRCDMWGVVWPGNSIYGIRPRHACWHFRLFYESMAPPSLLLLPLLFSPPFSSLFSPPSFSSLSLLGSCSFVVLLLQSPWAGTDVYGCGSWASDRLSFADWYLTWDVLYPYRCCNVTRDLAAELSSCSVSFALLTAASGCYHRCSGTLSSIGCRCSLAPCLGLFRPAG